MVLISTCPRLMHLNGGAILQRLRAPPEPFTPPVGEALANG
jgi:hypothetical protein